MAVLRRRKPSANVEKLRAAASVISRLVFLGRKLSGSIHRRRSSACEAVAVLPGAVPHRRRHRSVHQQQQHRPRCTATCSTIRRCRCCSRGTGRSVTQEVPQVVPTTCGRRRGVHDRLAVPTALLCVRVLLPGGVLYHMDAGDQGGQGAVVLHLVLLVRLAACFSAWCHLSRLSMYYRRCCSAVCKSRSRPLHHWRSV